MAVIPRHRNPLTLFSVRATEYAPAGFLRAKLALIGVGLLSALALHLACGWWLETARGRRLAAHAAVSILCWLAALLCGRLVAFSG